MEFIKEDSTLKQIVQEYISQRQPFSNYFMSSLDGMLFAKGEETLLLKLPCEGFNRIYFLSRNREELTSMLSQLSEEDAINIPTKREISQDILTILHNAGYNLFTSYERLYKNTNDPRGDFEDNFAQIGDCAKIKELLLSQLYNPITDRIPTNEEIKFMIENKQALVNRNENGEVNGVLLFAIDGKKCNFLEWASTASAGESLFLYLNAFNYMGQLGIEKSTIWVRSDNVRPKKIYISWGYQPDGLKDYTFLKTKKCDNI
jgi:hypothetical protein